MADNYQGPFRMLQTEEAEVVQAADGGCVDQVSRDRLKPHRAVKNLEPAVKRPSGRPLQEGD